MIRGSEERAHSLVMGSKPHGVGHYILEVTKDAFNALLCDISDEIEHKLSPAKHLKNLRTIYSRLAYD